MSRTLIVRTSAGVLFLLASWAAYTQNQGKQPPQLTINKVKDDLYEIEGDGGDLFLSALRRERPALARIETVTVTRVPALGRRGFAIRESLTAGPGVALGAPDAATWSNRSRPTAIEMSYFSTLSP